MKDINKVKTFTLVKFLTLFLMNQCNLLLTQEQENNKKQQL